MLKGGTARVNGSEECCLGKYCKVWRSGINWVSGDHCVFSDPQILDKSPSSAIWLVNRQDGSIVWVSARDNEALLKIIVNNRLDAWDNLRI